MVGNNFYFCIEIDIMSEQQNQTDINRIEREQSFHDQRFADDSTRRKKTGRFYKITQSIKQEYGQFIEQKCKNQRVVEYGCGTGSYAFSLANNGAKLVTGIDISPVAIEIVQQQAQKEGVNKNISFEVMNAEELKFNESSIDLICGTGILHHLDLKKSMNSIVKVLKNEGIAVFVEPLGHNILINLFRSLTPAIRSEDEHPLLDKDLLLLQQYFKKVEIKYFYFTALGASFFVGLPGFKFILNFLEFIDKQLFILPFLRKQAWQVIIKLSEPIK